MKSGQVIPIRGDVVSGQDTVQPEQRRDDMDWYWWVLLGVGVIALIGAAREIPAIRRYMRMKSM